MRALWALFRLRLLDTLRSRSSAGFVLLFPLVLLVVVGFVFEGGHPFEVERLVVVGLSPQELSAVKTAAAAHPELRVERAASEREALGHLRAHITSAALVGTQDGKPATLLVGPRRTLLGKGLAATLGHGRPPRVVATPRWGYVHYLFPGMLALSVMLAGLFATAYPMVLFRQNGFLKKLATTRLPRSSFVLAQIASRGLLIAVQIGLLVAAARLVFGLPLSAASAAWLALISGLGTLAFMGLGFALACVIREGDLVVDIISGINMPLVLLSEIFFPLDVLPDVLARVGAALPSTQMVRLARSALLYDGATASALAPGLAILAAWALGSFIVSFVAFRWHR